MSEEIVSVFQKRNIKIIPVESIKAASDKILEIIPKTSKIGYGGSVTLESIGVLDRIRAGKYTLYDRDKVKKGSREAYELGHLAQHADYFLASANAITKNGEIVNIDRTGNRVSSLIFGPEHVILVVGKNKIVPDLDAAMKRIKTIAAPLNAKRIGADTPCAKTGICADCSSPERLCCITVVIERQFKPGRMTIILVNEDLGY